MSNIIESPLPGIFYHTPSPEAEPYKKLGDKVEVGDVVGIVEAMKSFHEVFADKSGVITKVVIEHESPVQAGDVLFELE